MDPPGRLYPRVSSPWIVLGTTLLVVGAAVLLLATGGGDIPDEAHGDLTYIEGAQPKQRKDQEPLIASIADLTAAEVTSDGDALVFQAEVAAPLSQPLKTSALEFRWDISAEGGPAWTLTLAMDLQARASLISDQGYGAGTVDDTFPGDVVIEADEVKVRVDISRVEDFPEEFEWSLATTLRAFRNEPDSPRVEDRYPDESVNTFDG